MKKTKHHKPTKAKKLITSKDFTSPVSTLSTIVILGTAAWAFLLIITMMANAH